MDEKLKSKSIGDDELNKVAGGFKGDYSQIYGIMKLYGDVQGDVNDFEAISTPEERKKVQGVLSKAFGGAVEIGQYTDKENAYWYNGKSVTQSQIVSGLQKYYQLTKGR